MGWNKRLNYVLAFGRHGVTDVTKRYVPCWDETLARRSLVREPWLSSMCELLSSQCTALMFDSEERNLWTSRNAEELQGLRRSSGANASDHTGLSGRQSGSESWRRERGEIGQAKRNLYKLRNFVLTFSGENPPEENAYCLFDRRNDTKWLDFSFKTQGGEAFIGLEFEDPKVLKSYEFVSANDEPERDPSAWDVEGEGGGSADPVVLHTVREERFEGRHHAKRYVLEESKRVAVKKLVFRFCGVSDVNHANSIQLSQLNLDFEK